MELPQPVTAQETFTAVYLTALINEQRRTNELLEQLLKRPKPRTSSREA